MMNSNEAATLSFNVYYPASYYFCSPYVPELEEKILEIINMHKLNNTPVKTVQMTEFTYVWLFKIFTALSNPNPITSDIHGKYIFNTKIEIIKNLETGIIRFNP